MFLIIVIRLFTLQVITSKYKVLADDQGIFRKVVYPDRGIVFDRKNRAILQNTTIYDLMVIPAKIKGTDTLTLCNILQIDTAEFRKRSTRAAPRCRTEAALRPRTADRRRKSRVA